MSRIIQDCCNEINNIDQELDQLNAENITSAELQTIVDQHIATLNNKRADLQKRVDRYNNYVATPQPSFTSAQ